MHHKKFPLHSILSYNMKHMPVLRCPICNMTIHILFTKLNYFQFFQLNFCLHSCKKGHAIFWSIPFVIHPEELSHKNSTWI